MSVTCGHLLALVLNDSVGLVENDRDELFRLFGSGSESKAQSPPPQQPNSSEGDGVKTFASFISIVGSWKATNSSGDAANESDDIFDWEDNAEDFEGEKEPADQGILDDEELNALVREDSEEVTSLKRKTSSESEISKKQIRSSSGEKGTLLQFFQRKS